ncbi:hypothetical protein ILUMI_08064, partial [Ignelater luminosus]
MHYGSSTNDVRQLAYNYAVANLVSHPNPWQVYQKAGIDWLKYFLKRNKEATSLARSTAFNKSNVNLFFDKLEEVMNRYNALQECPHKRPFPKAGPRKAAKNCARKPERCRVLTDTPEQHKIEELAARKGRKDDRIKKQTVKRKIAPISCSSSSSSDDDQIELNESSQSEEEAPEAEIPDDLKENDF